MRKIKYEVLAEINVNDCWNHALALATGETYKKLRLLLKPFINEDGSLNNEFSAALLSKHDFFHLSFTTEIKVIDALRIFDSCSSHLVIRVEGHLMYVRDLTLYSAVQSEDSFFELLNESILDIWSKPIKTGEKINEMSLL